MCLRARGSRRSGGSGRAFLAPVRAHGDARASTILRASDENIPYPVGPLPKLTDFSYAAHAGSNTFLLDDDGVCRRILTRGKNRAATNPSTQRCLGAQYVASLDFSSESGLVERPKEGCPLLFARVDERGRVSLVRTAPLERFEEIKQPEREPETDEHPRFGAPDPDMLPPRTLRAEAAPPTRREPAVDSRRLAQAMPNLPAVVRSTMKVDIDYLDPSDRTQQRPALDPRKLPPLVDDDGDDNDATMVGDRRMLEDLPMPDDDATVVHERPAQFRKRGMLPKDRPSESLVPAHPHARAAESQRSLPKPPPSGRRPGR